MILPVKQVAEKTGEEAGEQAASPKPPLPIPPGFEFICYLAAGLVSFVTDFSVYTALTYLLGLDPLVAHPISRPLGGITCFLMNKYWTFRAGGSAAFQFLRFWCVFGVSLFLTEGLIALFCKVLDLPPWLGKLLAEGIAIVFNYLALKHWTFRIRRPVAGNTWRAP